MPGLKPKQIGSSHISVRGTQLSESPEPEVVKISVSESDAHDDPQHAVEGLDESIGNSLNKVVEDLLPPIAEGDDELGQVLVAGPAGFENPNRKEPLGLVSVVDFIEYPPEFLFKQVQGSKLRTQIEQSDQLRFL